MPSLSHMLVDMNEIDGAIFIQTALITAKNHCNCRYFKEYRFHELWILSGFFLDVQ